MASLRPLTEVCKNRSLVLLAASFRVPLKSREAGRNKYPNSKEISTKKKKKKRKRQSANYTANLWIAADRKSSIEKKKIIFTGYEKLPVALVVHARLLVARFRKFVHEVALSPLFPPLPTFPNILCFVRRWRCSKKRSRFRYCEATLPYRFSVFCVCVSDPCASSSHPRQRRQRKKGGEETVPTTLLLSAASATSRRPACDLPGRYRSVPFCDRATAECCCALPRRAVCDVTAPVTW